MIEVDRGDDDQFGIHEIRGVETSAEAGFEHHDFDSGAGECHERHGRHGFEEAGVRVDLLLREKEFHRGVHLVECRAPGGFGDPLAIDLNAFARIDQVGRSVEAGAEAAGTQRRSHQGAGGTFSVGPGYVDEAAVLLRIAQFREESLDAIESPLDDFEFMSERVEKADTFGEIHAALFMEASPRKKSRAVAIQRFHLAARDYGIEHAVFQEKLAALEALRAASGGCFVRLRGVRRNR